MATIQSDLQSALHMASSTLRSLTPNLRHPPCAVALPRCFLTSPPTPTVSFIVRAFSTNGNGGSAALKVPEKPYICTADELHYVSVSNSDWRLALWRYHPSPQAPARNHPLLLLSGVGTNAIGYDLSPGCSFARYMSSQGYDTWILEVRGAGLSVRGSSSKEIEHSANVKAHNMEADSKRITSGTIPAEENTPYDMEKSENGAVREKESVVSAVEGTLTEMGTAWDESKLVTKLTDTFISLSERLSGFLSDGQSKIMSAKLFDQISKLLVDNRISERFNVVRGKLSSLLETRQNAAITAQIRDLSQRLVDLIEEGQQSVSPPLFDLQERFNATIEDFQKQLDLIVKYDWDFDRYLEEDVPAAMEYIRAVTKPKDGKLLAIGHSMGGILLYAMLSRSGSEGKDPGLAAIVTLASSLDYTSSKSSLKLLLPLADPAQALNVPVVPLGALLSASYPLSSSPPYVLSWLNSMISAEDMMHPEMLKKLVLNNFSKPPLGNKVFLHVVGTIPAKLLLQLTTAFREGGLCNRNGTFFYKAHLHRSQVPVLALAGDRDLICPPEAVAETVKHIPEHLVTSKVFGEPDGPHYAHYDLVGGRLAAEQVYPCIIEFLDHHDSM